MGKNIRERLPLPEQVAEYLINTFYDISVDDGGGHDIEITDQWMEERFVAAGLIEKTNENYYPKKISEHMVLSREEALNLDNVAVSYAATLRKSDCMRENTTLHTTDAFYVNEEGACSFIEFKNGAWKKGEIKKKVYESIVLLNNLQELDKKAVITGNRTKASIETSNLQLSQKMKAYCGLDGTVDFYKKNVQLIVVYSEKKNIAREYQKLCQKKNEYMWMENKLCEVDCSFLRRDIEENDLLGFGYGMINKIARLLLSANSANRNLDKFTAIMKMLDRMKAIEQGDKGIKDVCQRLNEFPEFIEYLYHQMYEGNGRAETFRDKYGDSSLTAETFMKIAAKMSVERLHVEKEKQEKDDYETVFELVNGLKSTQPNKFYNALNEVWITENDMPTEVTELKKVISASSFLDLCQLLKQKQFEEVVKRSIFIKRVVAAHDEQEIESKNKTALLINLCGMEQSTAEKIVQLTDNKMRLFSVILAFWSYLHDCINIREIVQHDSYRHVWRQAGYLKELNQGHKENQKYGRFVSRIKNKTKHLSGTKKLERVMEEIEKIRHEIVEGKAFQEIVPIQSILLLTVSEDDRNVRTLQTELVGAVLRDVKGCRAIDFEELRL